MNVTIRIPSPLRRYTNGASRVSVPVRSKTVGDALKGLVENYGDLRRHLFDEDGTLRSFVNVYLNDEDVRYKQNMETAVKEKDEPPIVPSIAGGVEPYDGLYLSDREVSRYSRHLIIPEIGIEGQKRLKTSSVLLIGAGGLGSPAALYLAAAGVGRIGLVDYDIVEESNLQRQVIHGTASVGKPKLDSAASRIKDLNPNVTVEKHSVRLTADNALDILKDYDVILDGTDNFPTRYLVNDACFFLNKPSVYGSIFRFDGQVTVFDATRGPCYRCLYAEPPPPGLVPSCAEGGVLGVLPGVIGTIQATEAVKLLLGIGELLMGRLLLFDALAMEFRELKLRKDPNCLLCGANPTVTSLIDYEAFCGIETSETGAAVQADWEISATELKARLDSGDDIVVLDVREPIELQICRLENSLHIPMDEVLARLGELDQHKDIVVHCHTGQRSAQVTTFLRSAGFRRAVNLRGGIEGWAEAVDPAMPRY